MNLEKTKKQITLETLNLTEADYDYYESGIETSIAKAAVKQSIPIEKLQPSDVLLGIQELVNKPEHKLAGFYIAGSVVAKLAENDKEYIKSLRRIAFKMQSTIDGNNKRASLLYTPLGGISRGFKSFQ